MLLLQSLNQGFSVKALVLIGYQFGGFPPPLSAIDSNILCLLFLNKLLQELSVLLGNIVHINVMTSMLLIPVSSMI